VIAMSAATSIVQTIRATLRQRRMTYRELAAAIGVSEPTVKRDLSRGDFSLSRLDRICDVLELSIADLAQTTAGTTLLTQLSEQQERALVRDPRLLVVTYLVVNEWKWSEITSTFQLDDNSLISVLLRLDELGIVDYRPPHRMRKLTARNFAWRKDGPVHEFFLNRVAPEFLRSPFSAPTDELRFMGGMLSEISLTQMKAAVGRLAQEFEEYARRDARLALEVKNGCSVLLAMRQWEFSEFTRLRRKR
jgi:DNA-binding Xre family transcriptional regulator